MKIGKSNKGAVILSINENTYISFGKEDKAKWLHLSFVEKGGVRSGVMFKPDFTGIPAEAKKVIGNDNIKTLKPIFKAYMVDGALDMSKVTEIARDIEHVNL